ncbi:MAG: hypothetical protein ACF8PN_05020 [Phycisphaerales bacterium]
MNDSPPSTVEDLVEDLSERLAALYAAWSSPPPELIGQKPAGRGFEADYLGHAETTRALLEADPLWTLEPARIDPDTGGPTVTHTADGRLVAWWRLQVCGHERLCVGTCADNAPEPEKQLIGDAIRNGAMRFGVALALWSRQEWAEAAEAPEPRERRRIPVEDDPQAVRHAELTAELQATVAELDEDARQAFRTVLGGAELPDRPSRMSVEQLEQAKALLTELQEADK